MVQRQSEGVECFGINGAEMLQYYLWKRMLELELPGKRKRGRQKRVLMDVEREGIQAVDVTKGEEEHRTR